VSSSLAAMLRKSTQIYNDRWIEQSVSEFNTVPRKETIVQHNMYWDAIVRAVETSEFDELMAHAREAGRFQFSKGIELSEAVGRTVEATNLIELALLEANEGEVPQISIINEIAELRSMIVMAVADGYNSVASAASKAPDRNVKQELRELILKNARPSDTKDLSAGDEVPPLYEGSTRFHFVDYGKLRLYNLLPNGRCITVSILGPGDTFMQWRTEEQSLSCLCAEAMQSTRVISVSEAGIADMLSAQPQAALEVISNFARRMTEAQVLIEDLMNNSVNLRLYRTLLELSKEFGRQEGGVRVIDLPLTHQRLADMIGSNRVTVTRKLHDLQERGIIETRRGATIVLKKPEELSKLSTAGDRNM
jgi:CRP/FNR family cyclic AMP-dependent transcriptional regulator